MKPPALTVHEASDLLRQRELSSKELTAAVFDRIAATDDKVHSYITLCRDSALEQAKAADERLKQDQNSHPLLGIPLAIKNNFLTLDIRTTCASKILGDFIPPYDCTVISKIRTASAVITDKTNLDEFAMGSSAENSAFFPTRNPWKTDRIPGSSSGRSAAAEPAVPSLSPFGTDTTGQTRQPARL